MMPSGGTAADSDDQCRRRRHRDSSRNCLEHLCQNLKQVFEALREFMTSPDPPKRPIGFVTPEDKGKMAAGARSKT